MGEIAAKLQLQLQAMARLARRKLVGAATADFRRGNGSMG